MRIGFFEIEGWEEKLIKESFSDHEVYLSQDKIDETNLPARNDFDVLSIFVNSRIDQKVLENFPNLRFLTTRSTGYDHIDIEAVNTRNVKVAYVPGYGDNTVAEFTFGLILNLTRKMYKAIDQVKETGLFSQKNLRGIDVKGKTIGIIGTGRIGKEVVKIANGFDIKVLAYDPFPDISFAHEARFTYVSFEDLLKNSDIITIHCPHNEKTHHLINRGNIGLIKRGAYLINTARGPIIETEALVDGLKDGILAGAGLDVLEEEGEVKDELNFLAKAHPKEEMLKNMLYDHILMEMPNVLITPHSAFNSQEALERILNMTIENIKGFIAGKPVNLVQ
jgi:D-lactate dehydrogenase